MAGNSWTDADGGWDAVYPLSSSSSEEDESEHDPGTVAYRTAQATHAFASAQRGVGTQHAIPSASSFMPPAAVEQQPPIQNRSQNPPPAAALVPRAYSTAPLPWGQYLEEHYGSRQPSPPPTVSTTPYYEPERYVRSEGQQEALMEAMYGVRPTLGQLSQMGANPLLPQRVELQMPDNLLMDNKRYSKMSRRFLSPGRIARDKQEKKKAAEDDADMLRRMRSHRGPVALMTTGSRPLRRPQPAQPPTHFDTTAWSNNAMIAEGPVASPEPEAPRLSPSEQMETITAVIDEQTHPEVGTSVRWRTLNRPGTSSGSTVNKRSRPYDPAEVTLIRLDGKPEPLPLETAQMAVLSKENVSAPPDEMEQEKNAHLTDGAVARKEELSDWEDESADDIADHFAQLTVKDRKVRVCLNQGKLGESACGWKPGTDTDRMRAWGNMGSSCSCHCAPESVIDPTFRNLLTGEELRRLETHEARCVAFHRTERNCLRKCDKKLKLQGNHMELYWRPQSGRLATFCKKHLKLLREHKICPLCREFFAKGNKDFMVCYGASGNETHLYHLGCRAVAKIARMCPHCLESKEYYMEPRYDPAQQPERRITIRDHRGVFGNLQETTIKIPRLRSTGSAKFLVYCKQKDKDAFDVVIEAFVNKSIHSEVNKKSDEMLKQDICELKLWALVEARNSPAKWADRVKMVSTDTGRTLVHRAVEEDSVIKILLLSLNGADIHLKDASGETPLMMAVKAKKFLCVYALLKIGADVNTLDKDGYTPLHHAAMQKNYPLMSMFLDFKANASIKDAHSLAPALFHTLRWIPEACFNSLISRKLDLELQDANGWTFLHWAAFFHRNDLLKYFFETVTHWMRDNWGETPLHVAVRNFNVEYVRLFLTRQPLLIVDVQNFDGKTPYESARKLFLGEVDGKKRKKLAEIISLMERWMGIEDLSGITRMFPIRPIGEAFGDLSSGKAVAPIPVYNFVNRQFSCHELLYVRHVVAPVLHQTIPRDSKLWQGVCKVNQPYDKYKSCVEDCETGCRCASPDEEGNIYNEFVEQCYVPNGQPDHNNMLSRSKPPLSIPHRANLKERLLARMQRCSAAIAHDLLHILALIDAWTEPRFDGRSRRSHSMDIVRKRTIGRKRSESVTRMPENFRLVRPQETSGPLPRNSRYNRSRRRNRGGGKTVDDEEDQYRQFVPNPMDLFDEIQQCEVGALLESAVIRFERRHEFARWDLSVMYDGAPVRHARGRPILAANSKYHVEQLMSWEEYDPEPLVAMPTIRFKPSIPNYKLPIDESHDLALRECSIYCECGMDCPMRALQWPTIAVRLALVYVDELVGWGVMALTAIMAGQYIGEYTGELALGNLYSNDTYMYGIMTERNKKKPDAQLEPAQWSIDAKRAGSITRYANHSCNPNCKTATVSAHGMDIQRLCLIALRDIPAGSAITLNYGSTFWNVKTGMEIVRGRIVWSELVAEEDRVFCRCGEPNCVYKDPNSNQKIIRNRPEEDNSNQTGKKQKKMFRHL